MTRYLSICSGIEAATVAWEPLGWQAVGFSEIEAFPSAVLAHHYGSNMPGEPLASNGVPNFGDFTQIPRDRLGRVDVLVGGTPCQAFSFAGRRLSLADARGNLTLAFAVLAHDLADNHGLRNAVWENVPGVLSTDDNAFGCFLGVLVGGDHAFDLPRGIGRWPDAGMVAGPRARAAWRVLDAQYFGLAQRRERVFVVVDFGAWADPATVLFEPQGVSRHPPARGEARQGAASVAGGGPDGGRLSGAVSAKWSKGTGGPAGDESYNLVAHTLRGEGFDASEDGTGRGVPLVPESVAFTVKDYGGDAVVGLSPTLRAGGFTGSHANAGVMPAIAIQERAVSENPDAEPDGKGWQQDVAYTLEARSQVQAVAFDLRGREGGAQFEGPHDTANIRAAAGGSSRSYVATQWVVRRLTPTECERLQGFPDGYTRIPWRGKPADLCPDGPRYRALGNSMAVPVMRWIGERLDVELRRAA